MRQARRQKMKKTSFVTAIAIAMITLATGTCALAAARNATPVSVVKTNGSDVTLMPGAGSDTLRLHFSGAQIITREPQGGLTIVKGGARLLHYRPDVYQVINGEIKPVEVHFEIDGIDQVVVRFGEIDKSAPVI